MSEPPPPPTGSRLHKEAAAAPKRGSRTAIKRSQAGLKAQLMPGQSLQAQASLGRFRLKETGGMH